MAETVQDQRERSASMSTPLTEAAQATPKWLAEVLRRSGSLVHQQVATVEYSPGAETAMWRLVHLSPSYSPDAPSAPSALLLKLPRRWPGQNPAFHILGRAHEVSFYTHVAPALAMAAVPIVRCFSAAHDPRAFQAPETADAHVLVEDLSQTHWQPEHPLPPFEALCRDAVECAAGLHAAWWEHQRIGPGGDIAERLAWRLETARAHGVGNVRGAGESPIPGFLDFLGDRLSAARRSVYERVLAFEPELTARQARAPQTLLHGDPHWWNFLYPRDPTRDTTRILDWGSWRIGAGTDDLAYMLALQWFPERRRRLERPLLERYHTRLVAGGVAGYDRDALWCDYRLSVLWGFTKVARCWVEGWPTAVWWGHLERVMLAYEDLGCEELLGT
ncbi:MAG: phosphotransferase [Chloroflexi bacterium]|nr:phosphotransferase [Chloroflexota bacterium]